MYTVEVYDTQTGNTGTDTFDFDFNEYLWAHGNYECDCNIDDNRFKVTITDEQGKLLYTDRSD